MARQGKRRLSDLYVVGEAIEFDDGEGEPIKVFVRKLNAGEHERALRRANAARSKVVVARKQPDSDEYLNQQSIAEQFTRDDMIGYLGDDERQRRQAAVEAEIAAEDEWATDDYLDGLRDSLDDGLERPEKDRVKAELDRFDAQVTKMLDQIVDKFKDDLESTPDAVLTNRVLEKLLEVQGSLAWLTEFRTSEIWLAVREEDKRTPYFENREEVDTLPNPVLEQIGALYRQISVDPSEGKSSRQADTSSESSEPAANTATEDPSGQENAPA